MLWLLGLACILLLVMYIALRRFYSRYVQVYRDNKDLEENIEVLEQEMDELIARQTLVGIGGPRY